MRRIVIGALSLLMLASMVCPAVVQAQTGTPQVSLSHQFRITSFGVGILNDTITFANNGTSFDTIPSVQLGIPDNVASHAASWVLTPSSRYTMTSNDVDGVTMFTITPVSQSLAVNATSTVSLKTYLTGVLNITAGQKTNWNVELLLSPSLNVQVASLLSRVIVPQSGSFLPTPSISGKVFNSTLGETPPGYTFSESNVTPTVAMETSIFNDTSTTAFLPIQVYSASTSIVPSTSGLPLVVQQVTLRNLAYYTISSIPVSLLDNNATHITILPSTGTPTINPTGVNLTTGDLSLTTAPFSAGIAGGDNFTFTMSYTAPHTIIQTSGTTVSVAVPYLLPLNTLAQAYTVEVQTPQGISGQGQTVFNLNNVGPLTPGNVTLAYRINIGGGANAAVPAGVLVFGVGLVILMLRASSRGSDEELEEEEDEQKKGTSKLADIIKALEDKMALTETTLAGFASKSPGTVPRTDFVRVRTEFDSLKSRAFHRIGEAKQETESKRLTGVLNELLEAEREEDRAAKDVLNLYEQYQGRKMREETFQKLLPSYRKRLSAATNTVSDLVNQLQMESVGG